MYANNIKGQTVDRLDAQLDLLNQKYPPLQLFWLTFKPSIVTILISLVVLPLVPWHSLLYRHPLRNFPPIYPQISWLTLFLPSHSALFDTDLYIQPTGDKPVHLLANLMTLYPDGKIVINGDLIVTGTLYASNIDTKTATISGTLALGKGEVASTLVNLFLFSTTTVRL